MKGKISLKEFIYQVKDELRAAQQSPDGDAFYELEGVELEVSFALESKADGKVKLVVVELGGEVTATQTHKVTLKLTPLAKDPVVYGQPPTGGRDLDPGTLPIITIPKTKLPSSKPRYLIGKKPGKSGGIKDLEF
jgi:hypothetical protein